MTALTHGQLALATGGGMMIDSTGKVSYGINVGSGLTVGTDGSVGINVGRSVNIGTNGSVRFRF